MINHELQSVQATRKRVGFFDQVLGEINNAMEVLSGHATAQRPNPAGEPTLDDPVLSAQESKHVAGLMRVNHVGEVCAQALYRAQALCCDNLETKDLLLEAASEEIDHLVWCQDRLRELDSRPSLFNPLWYAGSFMLGLAASKAGVPKNLGFMSETERQVEAHLNEHLEILPEQDERSRKIITKMRDDEIHHYQIAEENGAQELPAFIKNSMKAMSKIMTTVAYRL